MIILDFALDNNGNIFIGGYFNDTCDFDPGNPVANLVSGSNGSDMFIAKYDNNGNYLWANKFGGTDDLDQVERIVTDDSGNVIVTGGFKGTVDFDPGAGTYNLVNGNFNSEYFFCKVRWKRKFDLGKTHSIPKTIYRYCCKK